MNDSQTEEVIKVCLSYYFFQYTAFFYFNKILMKIKFYFLFENV